MINWELPNDPLPCPHCGSTDTRITLQLLGLMRGLCNSCRKAFAVVDEKGPQPTAAADPRS